MKYSDLLMITDTMNLMHKIFSDITVLVA